MKKTDKLTRLEADSADMLQLLREQASIENDSLPPLRECRPYASGEDRPRPAAHTAPGNPETGRPRLRLAHMRISPLWLTAALVAGFVVGIALPRPTAHTAAPTALLTDSATHCRSLAAGDVNTALLVSL